MADPTRSTYSLRFRCAAALLLATFVSSPFGVNAQPVPVPTISGSYSYGSGDLDPYFNYADAARSQADWEYIIEQGKFVLAASWEASIDAEIEGYVNAVGVSDYFNSVTEYQNYLRGELHLQKQQQFAAWEAAANLEIDQQRVAFLTELGEDKQAAAAEESEDSVAAGQAHATQEETTAADIEKDYLAWEQDFQESFADGLYQFQTALAELQAQYDSANGALAQKEAEFAAIQAQIDAYEDTVRQGIGSATAFMQNYLNTSGVFYDWNCDGENNCSIDYGSPTPAAATMQALIDSLNDGLANDQPLSVLANTMFTALDSQRTYAQTQYANWLAQSAGTNTYSLGLDYTGAVHPHGASSNALADLIFNDYSTVALTGYTPAAPQTKCFANCGSLGVLVTRLQELNARTAAELDRVRSQAHAAAIISYYGGNQAGAIAYADTYQAALGNPQHNITAITYANFSAVDSWSNLHDLHSRAGVPIFARRLAQGVASTYGDRSYASQGNNAFLVRYDVTIEDENCGGGDYFLAHLNGNWNCNSSYHTEHTENYSYSYHHVATQYQFQINYNWEDANARHNADIWQGYVSDLDPVVAHWRDNILPAIQTWEAQVATFQADYAAWQVQAAQQRADAQTAYDSAVGEIIQQRNKWYAGMQEEYRDGRVQWQAVVQGKAEQPLPASVSGKNTTALQIAAAAGSSFGEHLNKTAELLDRGNNVPDFSLLNGVANSFEKSAQGLSQLALQSELNDRVLEQRRQMTEQIAQMAQGQAIDGIGVKGFETVINADGSISLTRQIHSGSAIHARGSGMSAEDYDAEFTEQALNIAPPPPAKLVDTGNLFDTWDTQAVIEEHQKNVEENQALLEAKFEGVQNILQNAQQAAIDNYERFQGDIQANITRRQKKKGLMDQLTSIVTAMFSGGISFNQALTNHMQNQVSAHIAEVTGWPAGIFNSMMGGMSAQDAVKDYVKTETDNLITQNIAKATGLPVGFLSGLVAGGKVDFSGENMKAAFEAYTDELVAEKMEEATGIPGLAGFLKRTTIADKNAKKAAHEAAQPKPEDIATGGVTYVWRNADHNENLALAVQASETVAGAAAVGTGWGTAAFAGYMAAKQAYKGYLKGDSSEDILKAAAASGVSSVANHYLSSFTGGVMSVNLSYDSESGFGGSVSASAPVKGVNLGASLNFQEGQGYTGGSINAGVSSESGYGLNASMNFSASGEYTGGSLSASYNTDSGFGGSLSANFTPGQEASLSAQVTYKTKVEGQKAGQSATHTAGLGLTYNPDGSYSTQFINSVSEEDKYGIGINSYSAGSNLSMNFDSTGAYAGHSTDVSLDFDFQTQGEKEEKMAQRLAELEDKFLNRTDEATQEELEEYYALKERNNKENRAIAQDRYVDRLVHQGKLTAEQAEELRNDPSKWHTESYAMALRIMDESLESRKSVWDTVTGSIGDAFQWMTGTYSSADGMLDTANGEFISRTCFVAGTLVHTEAGLRPIEEIVAGDRVLSWNESSGAVEYQPVTRTYVRTSAEIYHIVYDDGSTVETTWSHPFYIESRGWVEATDLSIGDRSVTYETRQDEVLHPVTVSAGKTGEFNFAPGSREIVAIEIVRRAETVYNFSVTSNHNYFVSAARILVHNSDDYGTFEEMAKLVKQGDTGFGAMYIALKFGEMTPEQRRNTVEYIKGRAELERLRNTSAAGDAARGALYPLVSGTLGGSADLGREWWRTQMEGKEFQLTLQAEKARKDAVDNLITPAGGLSNAFNRAIELLEGKKREPDVEDPRDVALLEDVNRQWRESVGPTDSYANGINAGLEELFGRPQHPDAFAAGNDLMTMGLGLYGSFGLLNRGFLGGPLSVRSAGAGPEIWDSAAFSRSEGLFASYDSLRTARTSSRPLHPLTNSPYSYYVPSSPFGWVDQPGNNPIPRADPAASGPHTILGKRRGTDDRVLYRQSATFPGGAWPYAPGKVDVPWSRVDWHDHSMPKNPENPHFHPIPHQHIYSFNREFWRTGPATPFYGFHGE